MKIPLIAIALLLLSAPPGLTADGALAGSGECSACHETEWKAWKTSHHFQAMRPATEETVLGDFSGVSFEYAGVTSRFWREKGKFMVRTDNAEGKLQDFEVAYTFGFYPLQQYLIPFPDGRLQALNIIWDSRPQVEGGQRWVHLYPDEAVTHSDIVHWTGSFQTWNSRCAVCHSTGLKKNYSAGSDRYNTTWDEINVACEACHGPASAHLEWARGDRKGEDRGFAFSLNDRGVFGLSAEAATRTASRVDGKHPTTQIETCAACHARRGELAEYRAGARFDDQYRLALIDPVLYYPDGQIRDEDYVYGSFLQSKMYAAGVVCTNCHDAHSGAVRSTGNDLCMQCHVAAEFDTSSHHRHKAGSAGAACVNCHMPATTYMVVDARRDHSFRVPEPRLTLELGIPNACNRCHADRDAKWASDALEGWGVPGDLRARHAPVLAAAWAGQHMALPALLQLASQPEQAAMVRASAVAAMANYPARETLEALQGQLSSPEALVREAAVNAMDWVPVAQRYAMLRDLIPDPVKSVRMAVARQLAGIPAEQLPGESARELKDLFVEYRAKLKLNQDMPEEQMNLGLFLAARGDPAGAEAAYRRALKLSPVFVPAMLNLADLYRSQNMDAKAEPLLERAIAAGPDLAAPRYALGLLRIRQGKVDEAVDYLAAAAKAEPANTRYRYVYAVALWEAGKRDRAVGELESALANNPGSRELVQALASYYQQLGSTEKLEALKKQYAF